MKNTIVNRLPIILLIAIPLLLGALTVKFLAALLLGLFTGFLIRLFVFRKDCSFPEGILYGFLGAVEGIVGLFLLHPLFGNFIVLYP